MNQSLASWIPFHTSHRSFDVRINKCLSSETNDFSSNQNHAVQKRAWQRFGIRYISQEGSNSYFEKENMTAQWKSLPLFNNSVAEMEDASNSKDKFFRMGGMHLDKAYLLRKMNLSSEVLWHKRVIACLDNHVVFTMVVKKGGRLDGGREKSEETVYETVRTKYHRMNVSSI